MKISIVGPGLMPIPPIGWGAVEILIWDLKNSLEELGHEVQIINTQNGQDILNQINIFNPDFVHIEYDEMIGIYPHLNFPKAITTHFAYLERPDMFGGYTNVLNAFEQIKPNIFCLSEIIKNTYKNLIGISEEKLFVVPNGVNQYNFKYTDIPKYSDRSIYLAKIDGRKRQHLFQSIDSIWYAGNNDDERFDTNKNYLGEWDKETLYKELTEYGNLVLLSDGEAHPLVCMEALASGLGLVISEWGRANLDVSKEFITIIPENKIGDINFIQNEIIKNKNYSINHRNEIREYSKQFEWKNLIEKYYIPSIEQIINKHKINSKMSGDKNKSAYKLKNIGPIYYLNLDGQPERRQYMEEQFKYWEIENYTRISAYDGRNDDLSDIISGRYPEMMTSGEIGCVTSHLKAIKHWMETSDSPYAIIMEDDCNLDLVRYWNFTWQDFYSQIPYDYDVVQIAIICTGDLHVTLHRRFVNDFSTACYLITRHHAEKLLKHHVRKEKYSALFPPKLYDNDRQNFF
jgi:glycosyltransferase involved in cell wall biosynthesis